jgi:hypothetical protein
LGKPFYRDVKQRLDIGRGSAVNRAQGGSTYPG